MSLFNDPDEDGEAHDFPKLSDNFKKQSSGWSEPPPPSGWNNQPRPGWSDPPPPSGWGG